MNETVPPILRVICAKKHKPKTVLIIVARGVYVPPDTTPVMRFEGTVGIVDYMPPFVPRFYYVNTPETPVSENFNTLCMIKCETCLKLTGKVTTLNLKYDNVLKLYNAFRHAERTDVDLTWLTARVGSS
jgi:hypothetical protein